MTTRNVAGQHQFSQIPAPEIQRSVFNRSCGNKLTMDAGDLVPVFVDEALPGDTFGMKMTMFGRIATLIQPIMDNMVLDTFFFAVPYRLVWDNWQKFMGEQTNPGDSTDFLIPQTVSPVDGYDSESLQDYLGIPTGIEGISHSALYARAYALIWNEWFRHQDLQDSIPIDKGDGPDDPDDFTILKRGKRHDYFTSALPWPQKGDSVQLPLGASAPVIMDAAILPAISTGDGQPDFNVGATISNLRSDSTTNVAWTPAVSSGNVANWENSRLGTDMDGVTGIADLSSATAATINSIRQAFQIQRLLERDARGGTRYTELIRSHFGVVSPDQRLQRPEYLGGGSQSIQLQAVPTTIEAARPLASLGAYGVITGGGSGFNHSFTEHCMVIGMVCLRADLNYQQGLERQYSRLTKYDFFWPTLAHLGEQAVLNKEIYVQGVGNPTEDEEVFGYQERFAEYRYKPSRISGKFRSADAASLDVWHLAQDFGNLPVLDSTFIEEQPPIDRVIAVLNEPHLLLDTYFAYRCARPMPVYSVPGLVDHF